MNPLRVTAANDRTFERLDVAFPHGCVAIVGPNGAGKSTILNAIDVALFAGRGELAALLTTGEDQLELQLTFEHGNEFYRVRRQFSARGRGKSTCDFEVARFAMNPGLFSGAEPRHWEPLTRATADETNEIIEETIGLSRTTFRASSFLAQGDSAAFTEAPPRDRKQILAEILDLHIWDRLHDRARADIRAVDVELIALKQRAESAQEIVNARPHVEGVLKSCRAWEAADAAALAAAEAELLKARDAIAETQAAVERAKRCESEYEGAALVLARAQQAVTDARLAAEQRVTKQAELNEAAALAVRVEELEAKALELRELKARADAALRERDQARTELERVIAEIVRRDESIIARRLNAAYLDQKRKALIDDADSQQTCDRCGQHLEAEARARAIESYTAEAAAILGAIADELPEIAELRRAGEVAEQRIYEISVPEVVDPAPVERALADARAAAERRAALTVLVQGYSEKAAVLPRLEAELEHAEAVAEEKLRALDEARAAVGSVDELRAAAEATSYAVATARARLDETRVRIAREQVALERCLEAEQELAETVTAHAKASGRLDVLKLAERAFGRDGIPALIVENAAIPQIETEANRILADLATPYRVELRTQRALKTDAGQLRETLDIVIVDGQHDRPYETFSGGERTRLNLALRIALARLLAHRRGAESRLLAIDEPEFLDEDGVQALAEVLRGLTGDFDRILLVSHHPTLAASFDQTIVVAKDGDRSRVAVDAPAEAVAA